MNQRIEALLREHLRSVDSAAVPSPTTIGDRVAGVERRVARRRRGLSATAGITAVALAAVVVWNTSAGPQQITGADGVPATTAPSSTSASTTSPTAATDTGPWSAIPPGPRSTSGATVVWTGTEAVMIGGTTAGGEESGIDVYDPGTSQWRILQAGMPVGGDNPLAFWTGESLVMIGLGAAYVWPSDMADPSVPGRVIGLPQSIDATVPWAWTGAELLVWPTAVEVWPAPTPRGFDPFSGVWRDLAEAPIEPRSDAASVWTGTEWIVWGGSRGSTSFADGAAYNPTTGSWRVLAAAPLSGRRAPAVWTGAEMIVAAGSAGDPASPFALADGAAYDPVTDTWRTIAPGLAHPGFKAVWTGELLILFAKGGAVWYDPAADQWSSGEFTWGYVDHDDQSPVWTGEVVLLLGSYDGSTGGAVFTPPTVTTPT
ncbi:MAG: hypothetical protein HY826_11315 [Actinobacteria bacterium]|nr:hypothetical protein [Actinomycetota bacterium]